MLLRIDQSRIKSVWQIYGNKNFFGILKHCIKSIFICCNTKRRVFKKNYQNYWLQLKRPSVTDLYQLFVLHFLLTVHNFKITYIYNSFCIMCHLQLITNSKDIFAWLIGVVKSIIVGRRNKLFAHTCFKAKNLNMVGIWLLFTESKWYHIKTPKATNWSTEFDYKNIFRNM